MARPSKTDQINCGLLSRSAAAAIAQTSRQAIRKLISEGKLKPFKPIGTYEEKISALELLLNVVRDQSILSLDLATAAVNYARQYQPDYLPYATQILQSIGASVTERLKIPLLIDVEETKWDDQGNVL
jgi:hypothetical protein